ncbi:MAG TPA: hypothetical protein PKL07_05975 [Bacillota bacterium]|nr:hypothetical protein [Bacillota bacterium]
MGAAPNDNTGKKGISRQFMYLLTVLAILLPLVFPVGMPVSVTPWVEKGYQHVEKLNPGDKVLISFDYSASGAADIHPAAEAIFKHLMDKDVKVITVAFVAEGNRFPGMLMSAWEEQGKVYGEDFIHLGFLSGHETGLAALFADIPGAAPVDSRGNPVTSYPIMDGVKTVADCKMFIGLSGGNPGPQQYVRQLEPYQGVEIFTACTAAIAPTVEPYLASGQIVGFVGGLKGAAEYETVMGYAGKASANMDAQSFAHLLVIGFIVAGNIIHFTSKKNEGN